LTYCGGEFSSIIDGRVLKTHMGLHDVLDVLINTPVKRSDDYSLRSEKPYASTTSPITFAKEVSKFLKWWNKMRKSHLGTLLYYRRLSKDTDCRVLTSKPIRRLSELRDYDDIKAWLRKLITRNKDFRF
jgi:hypothetical protein